MRIIKRRKLVEFCEKHPEVAEPLAVWYQIARRARWRSLSHMRETFPKSDEVTVESGRKAVIFNIKGNHFRLIAAVHYAKTVLDAKRNPRALDGRIFLFFLLTHAEYSKDRWKDLL